MATALVLGLLLAASPEAPTVSVAPAPGAAVASAILVDGQTVSLDSSGRGGIPAGASPSADGLRFSTIDADHADAGGTSEILYYPETSALASWPLPGVDGSGPASVVLKDHEGGTWENARAFATTLEKTKDGRRVRFAIPPGIWDAAIVVPGFAPAFVVELDVYESDETLRVSATKLEPAARVTARVLDARSGRPPERWEAWISRVGGHWEDEETKFFDVRPIARDGGGLDFASLPVGDWELRIEATGRGRGRARAAVKATKPRERTNLGDLYLADPGALRIVVAFPTEVPEQEFSCWATRLPTAGDALEELASKAFAPQASTDILFDDLETGPVMVQCGKSRQVYVGTSSTIVAGETAEVEFAFAPVRLSGHVRRGNDGVAGATVTAVGSALEEQKADAKSDELGAYALVVWPAGGSIQLMTTPPEDQLPFTEFLEIEADITEIDHDVLLPSRAIRGTVRDEETGAMLPGADVTFSGSLEAKGQEGGFSMSATSDEEGKFRVRNLLDQPLEIVVTLEGYAPSIRKEVRPTEEGTDIEILMEKGVRLTGVVVDELGAPLPDVAVGLDVDSTGHFVQRTETTADSGEFDFGAVAYGPHLLTVFRCGNVFAVEKIDIASYESDPPPRVVRLRPAAAPIELLAVDDEGVPVPHAVFRWTVGGVPLPMENWAAAARACGQDFRTDAGGRLRLYGFPPGVIGAESLDRVPLGTFSNDGARTRWTLRLPAEEEQLGTEVSAPSH